MKVSITKEDFNKRYNGTSAQNVINALNSLSNEKIEFQEKLYVLTKPIVVDGVFNHYYMKSGENLTKDKDKALKLTESEKQDSYWNDYTQGYKFEFDWEEA